MSREMILSRHHLVLWPGSTFLNLKNVEYNHLIFRLWSVTYLPTFLPALKSLLLTLTRRNKKGHMGGDIVISYGFTLNSKFYFI